MSRRGRLELAEHAGGISALWLSLLANYYAGRWASEMGSQSVQAEDLLLRVLPVVDARFLFTWGFGAFLAAVVSLTLWRERERMPWIAWSFALLILVRSACIVLTPLRSPDGALWVDGDWLYEGLGRYLTFKHDLFFSSHTASPFMAFLLFRDRRIKLAFLAFSLTLALTVLLARMHYSIDVAAAFAFTYAIHHANRRFLRAPYRAWRRKWLGEGAGRARVVEG